MWGWGVRLFLEDKFQFKVKEAFSFQAELGCLEKNELCHWGSCASGDAHRVGWLPGNA